MEERRESYPGIVPKARRRGEAQSEWAFRVKDHWRWAEPAVWTERMLKALEEGGEEILRGERDVLPGTSPCANTSVLSEVKQPTGEPYAGDLHVRFGERGDRVTGSPYPYHKRTKPLGSRWRVGRVPDKMIGGRVFVPTRERGNEAKE